MSKASVKKALKALDHESLIETIMELYTARKEARDYLEFWADPDIDREMENLKANLWKVFFRPELKPRRKPDFSSAKTLLKNFFSICHEPDKVNDMLIYYPETILKWLMERKGLGMSTNRNKLYTAIETAEAELKAHEAEYDPGLERRIATLRAKADDFYNLMPETALPRRARKWFKFS